MFDSQKPSSRTHAHMVPEAVEHMRWQGIKADEAICCWLVRRIG